MTKEWSKERHEIFKEKLYPKAQLSRLEFEAALEVFKSENPDVIFDDPPLKLRYSPYELKKFFKSYFG